MHHFHRLLVAGPVIEVYLICSQKCTDGEQGRPLVAILERMCLRKGNCVQRSNFVEGADISVVIVPPRSGERSLKIASGVATVMFPLV